MVIHELSVAECRQVLAGTNLGRLACARAGQPYIVPIFVYFDGEHHCLYSFSTVGQKIEWMRSNPKVCVEIDRIVDEFHWETVVVFGRYDEISDLEHESDARRRAHELFQQRAEWWFPALGKIDGGEKRPTAVIYRIHIDRMSGRRAARPPQA